MEESSESFERKTIVNYKNNFTIYLTQVFFLQNFSTNFNEMYAKSVQCKTVNKEMFAFYGSPGGTILLLLTTYLLLPIFLFLIFF